VLRQLGRVVYDLDDKKVVPHVIWVDVEAGLIEACFSDAFGRPSRDSDGAINTFTARGRFEVRQGQLPVPPKHPLSKSPVSSPKEGAPRCAGKGCVSTLTLPGDDLCVACRARERGQRNPMRVGRIKDVLAPHKCNNCTRRAVWQVGDEVEVSPLPDGRKKVVAFGHVIRNPAYERGATVGRRYYCDFCYKPPRVLDARGEVIRDVDEEKVRPQ
jgi:hypothetical protein